MKSDSNRFVREYNVGVILSHSSSAGTLFFSTFLGSPSLKSLFDQVTFVSQFERQLVHVVILVYHATEATILTGSLARLTVLSLRIIVSTLVPRFS